MRPVFALGVGVRGREVIRRLKEKIGEGQPYLVYCAVSTQEGEGAPLDSVIEDFLLAPDKAQTTSEDLGRYGPLANAEHVKATLTALLHAKESLQALFSQKAEALFSQERWVGAERTGEEIALYLVVDLADPLSLAALDLVRLAQKASDYPVRLQAVLLALEKSLYIYPALQDVWKALQDPAPLLSQGAFLIERKNERGEEGTEEERLAATVEWLERAVNDRLPYHDDIEKPHLGSFGIAQGIVPKERLNLFFALRWGSEFLSKWTKTEWITPGPRLLTEQWSLVEDLVEKPKATAMMPPNYATEVKGNIAPSLKLQQEHGRLYPEGKLPPLNDEILSDIRTRISIQEKHRHPLFLRNLQDISEEVLRRARQRLEAQIWEIFGRSRHPFAEGVRLADELISRLEEKRREAKKQEDDLKGLEQRGLFQEEPERKPLFKIVLFYPKLRRRDKRIGIEWKRKELKLKSLLSLVALIIRILLSLWVGLTAIWLFLFLLSRLVTGQLFVFIISSLLAIAVLFISLRSILIGSGLVIVLLPFLPFFLSRSLLRLFVLTGVFIFLANLISCLWPKIRLYELIAFGPPRPSWISRNYNEAERMATNALTQSKWGLLFWRIALTTLVSVLLILLANWWLIKGFKELTWIKLLVPARWVWPPLVLTAFVGIVKYMVDGIYDQWRQAQWKLLIPNKWLSIGWFLSSCCVALIFFWSLCPNLSNQEQRATLITLVAIATFAILYYGWQYLNDKERLSLLVREWAERHDGMAFLRFHLEAWRRSADLCDALFKEVQALKEDLQQWRESLQEVAEESDQLVEGIIQALEEAKEQRFPHYIVTKTPQELYDDFLREAGSDLEESLIREHGVLLWEERPNKEAAKRVLSNFIEEKTQAFWKKRSIAQLLGPRPDISWMLEPAFPFWDCQEIKASRKAYLGLPPTADPKYYEERISTKYGLIDPATEKYMHPTLFEEDQWTITALYYRYGVSLDKLGSLSEWKRIHEDELRHPAGLNKQGPKGYVLRVDRS